MRTGTDSMIALMTVPRHPSATVFGWSDREALLTGRTASSVCMDTAGASGRKRARQKVHDQIRMVIPQHQRTADDAVLQFGRQWRERIQELRGDETERDVLRPWHVDAERDRWHRIALFVFCELGEN